MNNWAVGGLRSWERGGLRSWEGKAKMPSKKRPSLTDKGSKKTNRSKWNDRVETQSNEEADARKASAVEWEQRSRTNIRDNATLPSVSNADSVDDATRMPVKEEVQTRAPASEPEQPAPGNLVEQPVAATADAAPYNLRPRAGRQNRVIAMRQADYYKLAWNDVQDDEIE